MGLYDNLKFDNGAYVPQYAGSPLQEIGHTAEELSNRHYTSLAHASQLEIMANQMKSKLLAGAKPHVDKHIKSIDQALQEITAQGGENATSKLNALATALQSDQGILNATQRAQEYHQQTGLIDKLRAEGHVPLYDKERRKALENASPDSELYQTPYESAVEPFRDPNPEMEDIWKVLNPDSYEGELHAAMNSSENKLLGKSLSGNDPSADLPMFFEAITSGGISTKKISDQLNNAWQTYKNTASYKQQTGKLVGKNENEVKRDFLAKGLTRVFNNLRREYRPTPAWVGRGAKPNGGKFAFTEPATIVQQSIGYDDSGRDLSAPNADNVDWGAASLSNNYGSSKSALASTNPNDEKKPVVHPNFNRDVSIGKEVYGKEAKNYKEEKELVKQLNDERRLRVSNSYVESIGEKEKKEVEGFVRDNYSSLQYADSKGNIIEPIDQDGKVSKEFVELTGTGNPENIKIGGVVDAKNFIGPDTNENFTRPWKAHATDKDGITRDFYVSQAPGTVDPVSRYEKLIYKKSNANLAAWTDLGNGVQVQALHGKQLDKLNDNDKTDGAMWVKLPGDTEPQFVRNPKELAKELIRRNIKL